MRIASLVHPVGRDIQTDSPLVAKGTQTASQERQLAASAESILKRGLRATPPKAIHPKSVGRIFKISGLGWEAKIQARKKSTVFHVKGWSKKFGMSLETREIKLFGQDIPGFCWDIPAVPEKFKKKMFVFDFCPPKICLCVLL